MTSSYDFRGKTAIVTGGGSGIGAALTRGLVARGAWVMCTDIDLAAAAATVASASGPGSARAVPLDVTDAAAVQTVVDSVVSDHGRIDLIFNNAGIQWIGELQDVTLAQWNAIIDINIRGVVHGIAAAYPQMINQGSGHIVNTASMGGLTAAGLLTPYVMTKHAVVGLSLALRSEAAAYGVGVTVVCPAATDTPLLDKGAIGAVRGRDYFLAGQGVRHPLSPEKLVDQVLDAVAANRHIVVAPRSSRAIWLFSRLAPNTMQRMATRFVAQQRELARSHTAG
ncbi:MAG TPA: SDR family oxidoreductase [Nocardioidaceae bacterium]|nr:SDR family oxidoreductase [Nocardioidaceae bacterium]